MGRNLNAAIRDVWGRQGADYMEHAIKDMYPQRQKAEVGDRMSARLRGSAAGAVLTFNMNVTFMQAASLPTAAAEAGFGSTGHAAVQFAKNVDPLNKLMSAFGLTENRLKKVEASRRAARHTGQRRTRRSSASWSGRSPTTPPCRGRDFSGRETSL